ncbi:MAG: replicative DNA helicase [Candidatus Poribacteria bacterium]|nr:replicative DNA helicase [Candidatus Poribacteria bacterium]
MASPEPIEPLHDREAERAVLGAMLMDTDVIPRIMPILGETPEAFFTTDHQIIYSAAVDIYDRHSKADILLVADHLKKTDQLKRVGGTIYLYDLQARIVETENTEFHAQIVRDKWMRRQLLQASATIREIAQDGEKELVDVLDESQEEIFRLNSLNVNRGFIPLGSLINQSLKDIEELYHKKEQYVGIPSGFTDLDILTSGLQRGDLIIIAARPSMGKTTLVLNIAQNIALEQELPVAVFSLEMPARQVAMRMLAAEAQIDFAKLRIGNITDQNWSNLTQGATTLMEAGSRISIHEARGITIQTVRAEARRLKSQQENLAVIIVDYLQLLRGTGQYTGREQEIAEISRALKALAWELDVPIIACSQLNRELERRPDKRPQLADLRESGAIEQDADLVVFLHRDDYYDEQSEAAGMADLIIRKQRNGATGTVQLEFIKEQMRFANLQV